MIKDMCATDTAYLRRLIKCSFPLFFYAKVSWGGLLKSKSNTPEGGQVSVGLKIMNKPCRGVRVPGSHERKECRRPGESRAVSALQAIALNRVTRIISRCSAISQRRALH